MGQRRSKELDPSEARTTPCAGRVYAHSSVFSLWADGVNINRERSREDPTEQKTEKKSERGSATVTKRPHGEVGGLGCVLADKKKKGVRVCEGAIAVEEREWKEKTGEPRV